VTVREDGNENQEGGEAKDPEDSEQEDSGNTGKVFTQEDLTRVGTREKDQGKRQGQREVLAALGVQSIEEAAALAQQLRDAEDEKLSEADRAKKEAETQRAEAERDRQAAREERLASKVERKLLKEGVDPKLVDKVSRLVEVDVDSTDEDIITAIADLKEEAPQMFSEPGSKETGTPKQSDVGKQRKKGQGPDPKQRAQERLQARHGDKLKSN